MAVAAGRLVINTTLLQTSPSGRDSHRGNFPPLIELPRYRRRGIDESPAHSVRLELDNFEQTGFVSESKVCSLQSIDFGAGCLNTARKVNKVGTDAQRRQEWRISEVDSIAVLFFNFI